MLALAHDHAFDRRSRGQLRGDFFLPRSRIGGQCIFPEKSENQIEIMAASRTIIDQQDMAIELHERQEVLFPVTRTKQWHRAITAGTEVKVEGLKVRVKYLAHFYGATDRIDDL